MMTVSYVKPGPGYFKGIFRTALSRSKPLLLRPWPLSNCSLGPVMLLVVFFVLGSVPQYMYRLSQLYFIYNIIHDDHTSHISASLSISSLLFSLATLTIHD